MAAAVAVAGRGGDGGQTRTSCLTWWRFCSGRRATGRYVWCEWGEGRERMTTID